PARISGTSSAPGKSSLCGCFPFTICISSSASPPTRGRRSAKVTSSNSRSPSSADIPKRNPNDAVFPHIARRSRGRRSRPESIGGHLANDGQHGGDVLFPADPAAAAPAQGTGKEDLGPPEGG